jgi:putative OPT family oligopeptide transporter
MAHDASSGSEFRPFIADEQEIPEFTPKAVILGVFFGILFGAATVYLALRAGLTVSASVPIAVLAIAVFKKIGKSTILENNIVQTIGSAGESVAAGVVFTIPALIFLTGGTDFFKYITIFVLSAIGGTLGVLFMIPLRRALIVKEHGNLKYPEGVACADVLIAGERGGNLAKMVFKGVGVAMLYKFLYGILGLWRETATWFRTGKDGKIPDATLSSDVTPEYLGLGYIIGPRIAGELASGGVLSWLAIIPLIAIFVPETRLLDDLQRLGYSEAWKASHSHAQWIYYAYVRYIGAGAVACAGVMTLIKTLPTIVSAFRESVKSFGKGGGEVKSARRTERDLGMGIVVFGSIVLALLITVLPGFPHGPFPGSLLMGLLVVVFGFFFVTVSSRIVGIIGTSSNPISGMTIATIMATCVVFVALGRTGDVYQSVALCVGAIVCIAAANAGATSQDLKTGYLVGATPRRQQIGFIIGVLTSTVVIGGTLFLLDTTYREAGMAHGIGGAKLAAPQATLMATIIKGLLAQNLPWAPVLVGVFLAFMAQMAGAHALSWAVGAYLPLSTTFPIFIGGQMKALADRLTHRHDESELSSGMLYSTGLVAGGSLGGVLIAFVAFFGDRVLHMEAPTLIERLDLGQKFFPDFKAGVGGDVLCAIVFAGLCWLLVSNARKKIEG